MTPKVSVVIPMLNARAYVADTLDGVFGQTVLPHEVIVVDNGSTDGSLAFVRERYPRDRVISEPVPGPSAARNAGAAAASGDLLAFCDSDDVWLPWKLERQLDLLAKVKARDGAYPGVATCRSQLVPDSGMRGAMEDWSRRPPLAVATITELGFEGLLLSLGRPHAGGCVPTRGRLRPRQRRGRGSGSLGARRRVPAGLEAGAGALPLQDEGGQLLR
jgi:glycosyltransferase involved in cell wall biosynthesis